MLAGRGGLFLGKYAQPKMVREDILQGDDANPPVECLGGDPCFWADVTDIGETSIFLFIIGRGTSDLGAQRAMGRVVEPEHAYSKHSFYLLFA